MNATKMPGFTAEASLYSSERPYLQLQRDAGGLPTTAANIVPAAKCCERCGFFGHWCCEECLM
jgi:hypothetical protein